MENTITSDLTALQTEANNKLWYSNGRAERQSRFYCSGPLSVTEALIIKQHYLHTIEQLLTWKKEEKTKG